MSGEAGASAAPCAPVYFVLVLPLPLGVKHHPYCHLHHDGGQRDAIDLLPRGRRHSIAGTQLRLAYAQSAPDDMSEERSKISLRSGPKRKGRPTISAPRQISSPILQGDALKGGAAAAPIDPVPIPRLLAAPGPGGKVSFPSYPRYDAGAPPLIRLRLRIS